MKILTDWVKKNRDKAALYKMDIEDGRVVIEPTLVNPNEIVSTMGCIDKDETVTIRQNGKIETINIGELYERAAKANNAEA